MPVKIKKNILSNAKKTDGQLTIQVQGAQDVDVAVKALRRAGARIAAYDAGWESAEGLGPPDKNTPNHVSLVYRIPSGPLIRVDAKTLDVPDWQRLIDIVQEEVVSSGITDATVTYPPESRGPFERWGHWDVRVPLVQLLLAREPAWRPPPVPEEWLEAAVRWFDSHRAGRSVWTREGGFAFEIDPDSALDLLRERSTSFSSELITGGSDDEVFYVSPLRGPETSLLLTVGGTERLESLVEDLKRFARERAAELVYAEIKRVDNISGGSGLSPVSRICDFAIPGVRPWMIIGPGHVAQLWQPIEAAVPIGTSGRFELEPYGRIVWSHSRALEPETDIAAQLSVLMSEWRQQLASEYRRSVSQHREKGTPLEMDDFHPLLQEAVRRSKDPEIPAAITCSDFLGRWSLDFDDKTGPWRENLVRLTARLFETGAWDQAVIVRRAREELITFLHQVADAAVDASLPPARQAFELLQAIQQDLRSTLPRNHPRIEEIENLIGTVWKERSRINGFDGFTKTLLTSGASGTGPAITSYGGFWNEQQFTEKHRWALIPFLPHPRELWNLIWASFLDACVDGVRAEAVALDRARDAVNGAGSSTSGITAYKDERALDAMITEWLQRKEGKGSTSIWLAALSGARESTHKPEIGTLYWDVYLKEIEAEVGTERFDQAMAAMETRAEQIFKAAVGDAEWRASITFSRDAFVATLIKRLVDTELQAAESVMQALDDEVGAFIADLFVRLVTEPV